MQSSGPQTSSPPRSRVLMGAVLGSLIFIALFIFAVFQARHDGSVLGWILAGILLGWLGLASYAAAMVLRQIGVSQKNHRMASDSSRENSMLDDKLAHSFQIILVQSRVIAEQRQNSGEDSVGMIDRALDTINTTARNGMGMLKDAQDKD